MATVLIIDDDDMVRKLLQEHLLNEGYEVVAVSLAEEGFARAMTSPPHLILLDVNLPDATGFQMCGRFKKHPKTQSIPIIMMTGAARWPNQQAIGKGMGASEYVLKPFDVFQVGDMVHRLVGSNRPLKPRLPTEIPPTISEPQELTKLPFSGVSDLVPMTIAFEPEQQRQPEPEPDLDPQPEPAPIHELEPEPAAIAEINIPDETVQPYLDLGVGVLILASRLSKTRAGRHTADQLLKCGTSAGARIQEALLTESKEDYLRILKAALKDIRETAYWLTLIRRSQLLASSSLEDLEKQCHDLSTALMSQVVHPKQNV